MNGNNQRIWRRTAVALTVTIGLGIALLASCGKIFSTPRQGWNRSYGPVVPHDKFPADCSLCHVTGNWTTIKKEFTFDHEAKTGVPLNGAHAAASCLRCHNDRGPVALFANQGCGGCHVDPHKGQLGRMCAECHQERTWQVKEPIAKHNRTRFPLVGAHVAVACFSCHPGAQVNNFQGADTRCATCHQRDLARATSPNHVALGWTTDCQKCHIAVSWTRAYFKHPAAFPLVGGHGNLACAACHKGGVFAALPTDCVSCHLANYQKTTNPNHIAAGFSTDCASCHNINSWQGAKFTHTPLFPLTGRHATLGCTSCHKTGVFTAMSTACVSCHLADYQNTKSPNHVASGFSTECATCHNTTSWQGAKFAHAFPIAAGPHAIACVQCHPNPANDTIFVCTNCHAHAQAAMSAAHREVKGYQWVSQSCYQCHRNGRAGD